MPNGEASILRQEGPFGPDPTIVHANETDHEELQMLADVGANVSVAPYVELVMGHRPPPFHRLLEHGFEPSLSMNCACTSPGAIRDRNNEFRVWGRNSIAPQLSKCHLCKAGTRSAHAKGLL